MEKVGILVVAYGAREAAIIDSFSRSSEYEIELYVADKQANPFNLKKATKHVVIPDLNIQTICHFAQGNKEHIDFGIVGPEKPIIEGVRDLIENETKIPVICPTKEYAIEESKVKQRLLFQELVPEANPLFKIFKPAEYRSTAEVKKDLYGWLDELENQAVVKPDRPAAGKGVGVWGDHFTDRDQLFDHFLSNFRHGSVIVEEKIEGEESSFQAFSDGKHLVPLPDTRDYKRAFDGDRGPNTGGMGSYKNVRDVLPFMTRDDRTREVDIANRIFSRWARKGGDNLRGMPLYIAFMHAGAELKILENNSRPGDPEIMNILPVLKEDFVDVCFKILGGNLTYLSTEKSATVVTYKAPPTYGGYQEAFPDTVNTNEIGSAVDLTRAYELQNRYSGRLRVYPAAIELRDREVYALKSRAVCAVGIADDLEAAREISLEGVNAITGGALWNRTDIASKSYIQASVNHMNALRGIA